MNDLILSLFDDKKISCLSNEVISVLTTRFDKQVTKNNALKIKNELNNLTDRKEKDDKENGDC